MEDKKIQEIFEALKNEKLTERERFVMRKELEFLMSDNPLRTPLHIRLLDHILVIESALLRTVSHAQVTAAALVLVLFVGAGTSYAAQDALPGDFLYHVKIGVNEKVQAALALSPQAKVAFTTAQTERRLEEAEALAAEGALTPISSAALARAIASSTADFDTNVDDLVQNGKDDAVIDARSGLDASLAAHERVLADLSERQPASANAINAILDVVQKQSANAQRANERAQDALAGKKNEDIQAAAISKKQTAIDHLNKTRSLIEQEGKALGTTTYTFASDTASSTAQTISNGDKSAEDGDYVSAFNAYQSAIQSAQEVQVGIRAQINVSKHFRTVKNTDDEADGHSED